MKRKAFTLIELLVVMAIIAILASIFFPIVASVRNNVQQRNGPIPNAHRISDDWAHPQYQVGDDVVVSGMVTGKVNRIVGDTVDILARNARGEIVTVPNINIQTLERAN